MKTASLSFYDMNDGETRYVTAAAVVSFPAETGSSVVYGPLSLFLVKGESAALQFSAVSEKNRAQANRLITPLYDRKIISIRETGFGFIITALSPGTAVIQTLAGEGIVDIAVVTVTEQE